jgi:hypothetical protein
MMADLGGTSLVYVTEPDIGFQTGNPLLLTHRRRVRAKEHRADRHGARPGGMVEQHRDAWPDRRDSRPVGGFD